MTAIPARLVPATPDPVGLRSASRSTDERAEESGQGNAGRPELQPIPEAVDTAVEEFLRYDSPVQMLFGRRATDQLVLPDLTVAAGQRVITLPGAANRDPRCSGHRTR